MSDNFEDVGSVVMFDTEYIVLGDDPTAMKCAAETEPS